MATGQRDGILRHLRRAALQHGDGPTDPDPQLQELLDQELARLPDRYRTPLVLCELEGRPLKEAARQLGWPLGTVASRLARARALLASRLAKSGLALPAAGVAALLSPG